MNDNWGLWQIPLAFATQAPYVADIDKRGTTFTQYMGPGEAVMQDVRPSTPSSREGPLAARSA